MLRPIFLRIKPKMEKFDLHIHSNMSDGTFDPEAIPALARVQGYAIWPLRITIRPQAASGP